MIITTVLYGSILLNDTSRSEQGSTYFFCTGGGLGGRGTMGSRCSRGNMMTGRVSGQGRLGGLELGE